MSTPVTEITILDHFNSGHPVRIQLDEVDFESWRDAYLRFGEPRFVKKSGRMRANGTMQMLGAFRERYEMCAKFPLRVTDGGALEYYSY